MDQVDAAKKGGASCCCIGLLVWAILYTFTLPIGLLGNVYLLGSGGPIEHSDIWDTELKTLSIGAGFDHIINMGIEIFNDDKDYDRYRAKGDAVMANEPMTKDMDKYDVLKCLNGDDPTTNDNYWATMIGGTGTETRDGAIKGYNVQDPDTFRSYLDGTPWCFSWPFLGAELTPDHIEITLNTGEKFTPYGAAAFPNAEANEKHCIVFFSDLVNRVLPKSYDSSSTAEDCKNRSDALDTPGDFSGSASKCAFYPTKFEIVKDLTFIGPGTGTGPWTQDTVTKKNGKGLSNVLDDDGKISQPPHPYERGPTLIGAHLAPYDDTGDSKSNDCVATYDEDKCKWRLRFYYTGGYTPNGLAGIRPTDYESHWVLEAEWGEGDDTQSLNLTKQNVEYEVNGGKVTVVGLSELAAAADKPEPVDTCLTANKNPPNTEDPYSKACYDKCYVEDHDNYIDIILMGDEVALESIKTLHQPSDGTGCYQHFYATGEWQECKGYQPLYNPGGGGNVYAGKYGPYFDNFVAGSWAVSIDVDVDLKGERFVTYNDGVLDGRMTWCIVSWVLWAVSFIGVLLVFCCSSPSSPTGEPEDKDTTELGETS